MANALARRWAEALRSAVSDFCERNAQKSATVTITLADGGKWDIRECQPHGEFILFFPHPKGKKSPNDTKADIYKPLRRYEDIDEMLLVRPSAIVALDVSLNQGHHFVGFTA